MEVATGDHHDLLDVEAAGGDVGGHEDGCPTVFELLQDALALALLLVTVDGVAADLPLEGAAELVAPAGVTGLAASDIATQGCSQTQGGLRTAHGGMVGHTCVWSGSS